MEETITINGRRYGADQYVDVHVAADFLGLSYRTVQDLAARRELPVRKFGRAVRFRLRDLQAWADRQCAAPSVGHGGTQ